MEDDPTPRDRPGTPRRVPGHALRSEGQAYLAVDCYTDRCSTNLRGTTRDGNGASGSVGEAGHALCTCGVLSAHEPTGAARKRWHRGHKGRILDGHPEPEGQPRPVAPDDHA